MKKLYILLLALLAIFNADAQSCLPEGITFTTQEQIDNFQTNYPGCTVIEGDVTISGNTINNLNGLSVLTSIGGNLSIGYNVVTNMMGLENLTSIGGHLLIHNNNALTNLTGLNNLIFIGGDLYIGSNSTLTSLTGLENLTSIGGNLNFYENDALTSLSGLENVTFIGGFLSIRSNTALISLAGLENLTSIGDFLSIRSNTALTSLSGLENLTSIGGYLRIGDYYQGNPSLTSLTGLEGITSIGGGLEICYNDALTSLSGLGNVSSIGGGLEICHNPLLTSLTGLEGITSIEGDFRIFECNALTSLAGLESVTSIGGGLSIFANDALTSLEGLGNIDADSITDLHITLNSSLSNCEVEWLCDYLSNPNGSIDIYGNAEGCSGTPEVADACGISPFCLPYGNYYFDSQADIDNFQSDYPGCTELQGEVNINEFFTNGYDITDLDALVVVTSIGGELIIWANYALSSLMGLENLTSIGGGLVIGYNHALTSLTGLENLDSIGGELTIYSNYSLTSLTGLDNVAAGRINDLNISENISLSNCAIQSICDYLAAPFAPANIDNNATGCNSPGEVEAACDALSVSGVSRVNSLSLNPNPANDMVTISTAVSTDIARLLILTLTGQLVMELKFTGSQIRIDIGGLPPGVFIVRLQNKESVAVTKLIRK